MSHLLENVIIIGSGPSGHTAAIYTGRAKLAPLMLEGEMAGGVAAGGQLTTTTDVENFPGFPEGIMGPELMSRMRAQAEHCGARIETKTVDRVDLSASPFKVYVGDREISAKTLIIATGATAKRLGVPGEELFWQKGISACAVCDGGLPIFRNKPLVVVGGGDTAAEEASYLSKFASSVALLVRGNTMRASKAMQERVFQNPKIIIHWETELVSAHGDTLLSHVHVINTQTKQTSDLPANGLFYAIGHQPNTSFLDGQIKLDSSGYIVTDHGQLGHRFPVFLRDVQDKIYRQAITAAGTGCMAALEAEHWLASYSVG